MMYICGKGKDDYLTRATLPPSKNNLHFWVLKAENNMVVSWLINSMNNMGENFLHYNTAKEIWEAACETYSTNVNTAELFRIEGNLHDLRQGEMFVTQ